MVGSRIFIYLGILGIATTVQAKSKPDIMEQEINKHFANRGNNIQKQGSASQEIIHIPVAGKKQPLIIKTKTSDVVQRRMTRALSTGDRKRTRQGVFLGVSQVSNTGMNTTGQGSVVVQPKKNDTTKPIEKKLKDLYPFTQDTAPEHDGF